MVSRWRVLALAGLLACIAGRAAPAAIPDIDKPLMTVKGAQGCDSVDALKHLLAASPGSSVTGCLPIGQGTRGYFLNLQGDSPPMIELDIRVDTRERILWVPADQLRN
jgi:hypothetical protein